MTHTQIILIKLSDLGKLIFNVRSFSILNMYGYAMLPPITELN